MTKHFLIVANGDFLSRHILLQAAKDKIIIALDGAADKLTELDIIPDVILGDFDSISSNKNEKSIYIHTPHQDQTDLIKAIRYCDQQQAESISIVCATGGRMDHHEGAVRSLRGEYRKSRILLLHTAEQTLQFAKDETITIKGNIGDKCGVLAFPSGQFSSQGLEYDVCDHILEFGYTDSICNALKTETALIKVTGEALVVMPLRLDLHLASSLEGAIQG